MDIAHPQNAQVLAYLTRAKRDAPEYATWDSVQNPYYGCGCHPDIVERIWDQIGKALPADCRCLIHGIPTLAHPKSGVILALGIGTQYGLRLPPACVDDVIKAGAKTTTKWSGGAVMDIRLELGDDWIFGAWLANEPAWCATVYAMFDRAA